jgi:hypothetical protein
MKGFNNRLREKGVGASRRATMLRSADARIDRSVAIRRTRVAKLLAEIDDLEDQRAEVRRIAAEVEEAKTRGIRTQKPAPTTETAKPVKWTRFSDLPKKRSDNGRTWSGPFDGAERPKVEGGAPFKDSDFVNDDAKVLLRCAGAIHATYVFGKQRHDLDEKVFSAAKWTGWDDLLLKPEACEAIYDLSALRKA